MTAPFGARALILCGLAARTLGWRPTEFWTATPAELATVMDLGMSEAAPAIDRDRIRAIFGDLAVPDLMEADLPL